MRHIVVPLIGVILAAASVALADDAAPSASPLPSASPSPAGSAGPGNTQVFAEPHSQFLRALQPLPEIHASKLAPLIGPAEVDIGPLLVSLDDVGAVSVLGADGKVRVARAGDPLEEGDSFQTGEHGSARVAFESGVQVLAPPGVVLHLDQVSVAGPLGGFEVPMVELEQGEIRLLVETASGADAGGDKGKGSKPLKLLVRTKAGVLGVRGTDFVVSVADDHAHLFVIGGIVELAPDAHALGLGLSAKAGASELAELIEHRPLPRPEHYEIGTFLREFHDRNGRLEEMWNAAVRDARTHRLRPRFLEIRTAKADVVNLKNGYPPAAIRKEAQEREDEARKWQLRKQGLQDEKGLNTRSKRPRRRRIKKSADSVGIPAEPADDSR